MRKQKQLLKKLNLAKILFNLFLIQLLFNLDAYAMSKTEKYLEIVANSEKASYFIKFNDVKLFSERSDSPIRHTLPINHWSINGENKLLVSVNFKENIPLEKSSKSKLIASLYLREKAASHQESYLITRFDLSPSTDTPEDIASSSISNIKLDSKKPYHQNNNGKTTIGSWSSTPKKKWIRFEQTINININLPEWSYLTADYSGDNQKMTDDDFYNLSDEVFIEYQKIWNLMKNKDIETLLKYTDLRSSEMNKAFYLDSDSKQKDMRNSLYSAFNNKDLTLYELIDNQRAQLSIMANGRLANIKVAGTDVPPILFTHIRGSFTRSYNFYFMKKDDKWIIIR